MKIQILFSTAAQAVFSTLIAGTFLTFTGCRFQTYPASYKYPSGVTYTLQVVTDVQAKADLSLGSKALVAAKPYTASSAITFSFRATNDTSKGQTEWAMNVDTLDYHSVERVADEDKYMVGRLKKYHAKIVLTRSGQALSIEEEPGLPPVEFSTLNFGRLLLYGLAAFPDGNIHDGMQWDATQSLLDKFHPDSRIIKHYTVKSIGQTPDNRLATCRVEVEGFLDEDLGSPPPDSGTHPPTFKGEGEVVFDLDKGRMLSSDLEIEGRFLSHLPPKTGDSAQAGDLPLQVKERLRLRFPPG